MAIPAAKPFQSPPAPISMKLLLVSPPRYYWPFVNEDDNWLLPQSLACLGAYARAQGHDVKILDCQPIRMGWQSLRNEIERDRPDVIAVGENHALYAGEALKVVDLAHQIDRRIKVVLGGSHFSNLVRQTFDQTDIDALVLGEGEVTLSALMSFWENGGTDPSAIDGVAFKRDGEIVRTKPRALIPDLSTLPMPAYDLMPMEHYGKGKYLFSPGGMTMHHSRGCVSRCSFCGWWTQMADVEVGEDDKVHYTPRWRNKTVQQTVDEIDLVYHRYGKRCLVFVDESWNMDPRWNEAFAEEVLSRDLGELHWFAFMRADALVRDERKGILEKLVRSGLCHLCVGVERAEDPELKDFEKGFYNGKLVRDAFHILKSKYPGVFRQATFIVGIRDETEQSMMSQVELARDLHLDYPGFHPITPIPGTAIWDQAISEGWIEEQDFNKFDWMTPVMPSKYLSRDEISYLLYKMNKKYVNLRWLLRGLTSPKKYKRHMYVWWVIVAARVALSSVKQSLFRFRHDAYTVLRKPDWYDA